ncbi:hypothetical protein YC2023_079677 [Brassica napus]
MTSLLWLTAEEAAKNRGKVLSLYRQLLRSINLLQSHLLASWSRVTCLRVGHRSQIPSIWKEPRPINGRQKP